MKKLVMLFLVCSSISSAFYCETGYTESRDIVQGGYYVTYKFDNGKNIGIKYNFSEFIPHSIRFNFSSMELCR